MVSAAVPFGISLGGSVADLVLQTGLMGRAVLVILLFFSVVTWAIIVQKFLNSYRSKADTRSFQKIFYSSNNLTSIFAHSKTLRESQLARLFIVGYNTLKSLQRKRAAPPSPAGTTAREEAGISSGDVQEMARILDIKSNQEMAQQEKYLIFLATAGTATPFIGLFGTVWGVMSAFRGLGLRGSASIDAVAPGISEALIATAAGLAVAIPSVIGYNFFINRGKIIGGEMDNFNSEFISIIERNFVEDK